MHLNNTTTAKLVNKIMVSSDIMIIIRGFIPLITCFAKLHVFSTLAAAMRQILITRSLIFKLYSIMKLFFVLTSFLTVFNSRSDTSTCSKAWVSLGGPAPSFVSDLFRNTPMRRFRATMGWDGAGAATSSVSIQSVSALWCLPPLTRRLCLACLAVSCVRCCCRCRCCRFRWNTRASFGQAHNRGNNRQGTNSDKINY